VSFNHLRPVVLVLLTVSLTGCSTLKEKPLLSAAASFAACSIVGAVAAPKNENKEMHGILYGGLCSTASLVASNLLEKNSLEIKEKKRASKNFNKLEVQKNLFASDFYKNLPSNEKSKFQEDWSAYSKSEWVMIDDKLIHENLEIDLSKKENTNEK